MPRPESDFVTPRQVRRLSAGSARLSFLTTDELAVLGRLTLERRRRDWLAGRLAAKRLLQRMVLDTHRIEVPLHGIEIRNRPDGVPFFAIAGRPALGLEWNISIAHADGYGVCALARTAEAGHVGVDLEVNRPLRPELHRYFLSAEERSRLNESSGERTPNAVTLWAVKEAVLKAGGCAVWTTPRQVRLRWNEGDTLTVRLCWKRADGVRITAAYQRRGKHVYAYAICRHAGDP